MKLHGKEWRDRRDRARAVPSKEDNQAIQDKAAVPVWAPHQLGHHQLNSNNNNNNRARLLLGI